MKPPERHTLIILTFIFALIAANNFVIGRSYLLRKNADAYQINEALQFCHTINTREHGGFFQALKDAAGTKLHPHLYTFLLGTVMSLDPPFNDKDMDPAIQYTNTFFLLILLLSVYGIGAQLFGKKEGLLAAILTSLSPAVFGPIRLALTEIPLAAFSSLTILLLLKSGHFASAYLSIAAGCFLGFSFLIRESAPLFILPAALYLYLQPTGETGAKKRHPVNLALFLTTGLAVSSPVFLNPNNKILYNTVWNSCIITAGSGLIPQPAFLYLRYLPEFYTGWYAFLFTLPALAGYAINIRRMSILPAVWLAIPCFVCPLSAMKAVRYLAPAVPALFLIISAGAFSIFKSRKAVYSVILVSIFILQFLLLNFHGPKLQIGYENYNDNTCGLLAPHREADLTVAKNMANRIVRDAFPKTSLRLIGFPSTPPLERMQYLFTLLGVDTEVISLTVPNREPSEEKLRADSSSADYFIEFIPIKPGLDQPGKKPGQDYQKYKAISLPYFQMAEEFKMRNNIIYVYKRNDRR